MTGKFRKVVQKIAAVGTSVGFVRATLMGASAYSLADYPSPFIKDGIFNGQIVIGAAAKTSDVIGATDIATSLQFATAAVGGSAMGARVTGAGDSTLIAEGGDFLNLDEFFSDVIDSNLDDSDLPNALKDGEFDENEGEIDNDETYTQEITFPDASGPQLVFEDNDDNNEEVGDYIKIDNGDIIMSYTVEFDTPVEYTVGAASKDLEDSVFEMQGHIFTITDIKETAGSLKEVEVIGGETLTVLQRGEVRNYVLGGMDI